MEKPPTLQPKKLHGPRIQKWSLLSEVCSLCSIKLRSWQGCKPLQALTLLFTHSLCHWRASPQKVIAACTSDKPTSDSQTCVAPNQGILFLPLLLGLWRYSSRSGAPKQSSGTVYLIMYESNPCLPIWNPDIAVSAHPTCCCYLYASYLLLLDATTCMHPTCCYYLLLLARILLVAFAVSTHPTCCPCFGPPKSRLYTHVRYKCCTHI